MTRADAAQAECELARARVADAQKARDEAMAAVKESKASLDKAAKESSAAVKVRPGMHIPAVAELTPASATRSNARQPPKQPPRRSTRAC